MNTSFFCICPINGHALDFVPGLTLFPYGLLPSLFDFTVLDPDEQMDGQSFWSTCSMVAGGAGLLVLGDENH